MRKSLLVFGLLWAFSLYTSAQGTNCSNAIAIPLDGTCNNYATSGTTGMAVHCSGQGYGGNGRVTYFRFTTNGTPQCVSLDITASVAGTKIEAVLYSGCSGTTPTGGNAYQSLCMDDGNGVWATNLWYSNLAPNTTYYLRVRTEQGFAGTLTICGKFNTPTNNLCSGATGIDDNLYTDNNACNSGSTEVAPGNLCAGSLENTSWYAYTVLTTGTTSLIIGNLNCDNANFAGNNDYGFQVGFFTGTCGNLTPLTCNAQTGVSGGSIITTTPSLAAGTTIYVAIDGFAGSNCKYSIIAINSVPLAVKLTSFDGWKAADFNLLTWITVVEKNNLYFEIERSADGTTYLPIGRIAGETNSTSEKKYFFKDNNPLQIGYYRLKQVDDKGDITYSRIIKITRETTLARWTVSFQNPAKDLLKLNLQVTDPGKANIMIVDGMGRKVLSESVNWQRGFNQNVLNISKLAAGTYYMMITQENYRKTYSILKN